MAYDIDKKEKIKDWFYNNFLQRDWEKIWHQVYDLYEEEMFDRGVDE